MKSLFFSVCCFLALSNKLSVSQSQTHHLRSLNTSTSTLDTATSSNIGPLLDDKEEECEDWKKHFCKPLYERECESTDLCIWIEYDYTPSRRLNHHSHHHIQDEGECRANC
jgi:hypothetical protein